MKPFKTIPLSTFLIFSSTIFYLAGGQAENGYSLSNDTLININALDQYKSTDCSYIRRETHCVFKRVESIDTTINGKKTKLSILNEVPYYNMAVSCKPGGNMSCKNITCEDVWQVIKAVDPNVIYMKQPKSQKYFDKFLKKR